MINDIKISDNFKLSEFQSGDTKEVKVDQKLIDKLEKLRKRVGQPLVINSGYRTPERNEAIGGADGSLHKAGKAADIAKVKGLTIDEMAVLAQEMGFDGIGKYNGRIHVDVRENGPARWDNR